MSDDSKPNRIHLTPSPRDFLSSKWFKVTKRKNRIVDEEIHNYLLNEFDYTIDGTSDEIGFVSEDTFNNGF